MFRQSDIPKRLIPGTIALGAFTFTMDSLARHAADPEHHPDDLLQDHDLGRAHARHHRRRLHSRAPASTYLEWRRRQAARGRRRLRIEGHINEPEPVIDESQLPTRSSRSCRWSSSACEPRARPRSFPPLYGAQLRTCSSPAWPRPSPPTSRRSTPSGPSKGALLLGIFMVFVFAFRPVIAKFADGTKAAVAGALLASTEHGVGIWLWRGHRRPAGLSRHPRRAEPRSPIRWSMKRSPSRRWPASPARPPAA